MERFQGSFERDGSGSSVSTDGLGGLMPGEGDGVHLVTDWIMENKTGVPRFLT